MEETPLTDIFLIAGVLLCLISLLALLIGFLWAVVVSMREGVAQLKRLHSIPCVSGAFRRNCCLYFTDCRYLKCTIHPDKALTEDAVDCLDFEPAFYSESCCSNRCKRWIERVF